MIEYFEPLAVLVTTAVAIAAVVGNRRLRGELAFERDVHDGQAREWHKRSKELSESLLKANQEIQRLRGAIADRNDALTHIFNLARIGEDYVGPGV